MQAHLPGDLWSRLGFLVRYGVVGVVGGLIQVATLYVWISLLRLQAQYLIGAVLGFLLALSVTFLLQKHWTFRDRSQEGMRGQFVSYTVIALISLVLNVLLLALARDILTSWQVDFFKGWYLVAQAVIVILLAGMSFILNTLITFRRADNASREPLS